MLCQLTFPVFFDHFPDFVHTFNDKHLCISQIILCSVLILGQESVVFLVKGICRIQQAGKMVIERPAPDERIAVRIRFYFCSINVQLFKRNESLFL